ncbi:hypothetical protein RRF57_004980 [Xylaria bambusicola]|uniref:DUF7791 domain-containing protein n=1 Tax=Xylaria bambusicola TaxID=326684 RepID=A0AAN7UB96_9PEZI
MPERWKLITTNFTFSRELDYRDFQDGFDNILKHASNSGLYKVALFIDRLDEFEGRHLDLITTMKEWSEKYSSVLKICVSSRDYSVFQVSFSPYPKLRLHECTSTDIARMVSTQLKSNQQCAGLFESDETLQAIVELITTRAEGVFLWVSIVLASIEDAIMSGASLWELETRIEAYPTELDPLYWHLMNLICETDRKWAFRTLKLVQFFQTRVDEVEFPEVLGLSLLELSFLDDISYGDAIMTSSKALILQPKTVDDQLHDTYRKVYGRCKGFLHVRICGRIHTTFRTYRLPIEFPAPLKQEVVLIHRSIVEFLETPAFATVAAPYLYDFNCLDAACGTLLQCIEYHRSILDLFTPISLFYRFLLITSSIQDESKQKHSSQGGKSKKEECPPVGEYSKPTHSTKDSITLIWKCTILNYLSLAVQSRRPTLGTFISFLDSLREVFLTHSEENGFSVEYTAHYFAFTGLIICSLEPLKQMHESHSQSNDLIFDYFMPSLADIFQLCYRYGCRGAWSHVTQDQFIMTMTSFLHLGLDFNNDGPPTHWCTDYFQKSPWETVIYGVMANMFPTSWCPGVVVGWFLRHGANPDLIIGKLSPHDTSPLPWLGPGDRCETLLILPNCQCENAGSVSNSQPVGLLLMMNKTSDLCQLIKANKGVLTFRILLDYWYPDNQYFHNLIDGLQNGNHKVLANSTSLPSAAGIPLGAIRVLKGPEVPVDIFKETGKQPVINIVL